MKFLLTALLAASIGASAASASDIKVRVKAPSKPEDVISLILPLSFVDNGDGTSTLALFACGSEVVVTTPNELIGTAALEDTLNPVLERACAEFLK